MVVGVVVWKEGNVLFNDALNTFLFTVIWCQWVAGCVILVEY